MNPLTQIPSHVRTWLYWAGYALGVISQAVTIVWGAIAAASPAVTMPLGLVIASAVIAFAQTQLNLLAGANVTDSRTVAVQAPADAETTVRAEVEFKDDRGEASVLHLLLVIVVVLVILAIVGVI